jgi:hypothetical protein
MQLNEEITRVGYGMKYKPYSRENYMMKAMKFD